ncbi:MAG: translation initiation factor IF-2 [Bacteroidales bacterium]|nr:translation initiation factor IF-2 [Bacteroidales bacterium]
MAGARISNIASEFNVGATTIIEFLHKKGYKEDYTINSKVPEEVYAMLKKEYSKDKNAKEQSERIGEEQRHKQKKETISIDPTQSVAAELVTKETIKAPKILGKIDLDPKPAEKVDAESAKAPKAEQKEAKPEVKAEEPKKEAPKPAEVQAPKAQDKPKQEAKQPEPKQAQEKKAEEKKKVENNPAPRPSQVPAAEETEPEVFRYNTSEKLSGPKVLGKIELPVDGFRSGGDRKDKKQKRKRIKNGGEKVDVTSSQTINQVNATLKNKKDAEKGRQNNNGGQNNKQNGNNNNQQGGGKKDKKRKMPIHTEVSDEDVQKQVKETLARLTTQGAKTQTSKHRREKRQAVSEREAEELERLEEEKSILRVTEFVTTNELANMMNVPVTKVIGTFMSLGMFVSINQRLDAESMAIVAEEYGFKVEFISVESASTVEEEEDDESMLEERPPIVTVMGHVDHGKTSLLDYIRKTNVISGEAGGITQHIGAYNVKLPSGRHITFLDTPGHEAFTAMRARGAQVTDIAIIIVAADDSVMPQTIEAINHAAAANVPIVFAINKIDKPGANPDKIREALANMNYLVEEWGGKYQCQEISAKKGLNVDALLEKVLLEADIMELKANPNRRAVGNVIESSLDKGRGYQATMLVSNGTLKVGDMMVCGSNYGRVKAMFNERNQKVEKAGPSEPVLVLGLNGAPQAGEKFNVFEDEREAKEFAQKREQLQREQALNAKPHMTLDEIGRRIAIGNFKELNIVIKGDVDGSIQALSESFQRLSTEEIQVNIIHKAVGQISETDVNMAIASDAIIVGFQVRPSAAAKKLAEQNKIDIRQYSIIYDAIEELKDAMEGMLSPEIKEQVTGTLEILETFKISKVGTIAGCMVKEGKVKSKSKVRVIREGIVQYSGALGSLKRFKDDVKEVVAGLDCGMNIENYNDIQVGDIIEAYEEIEISRKL